MKKLLLSAALLFTAAFSNAQAISDDLSWVSGSSTTSATSPVFNLCNSQITYTITSDTGFKNVSTTGNPSLTNGLITPADIYSTAPSIPMTITFNQPICNLRIRFDDLDGPQNEAITSISPAYSNLTDVLGHFFDPGIGSDAVNATINNARGWVEWNGPVTSVTFNYLRPSAGCGLVIDSLGFECCSPAPCRCQHKTYFQDYGSLTSTGAVSPYVVLNSNGIAVRSICIDLPYYVSAVDDDCLKCDVQNQERFGTIIGAQPISGTVRVLSCPLGLGYSRKICWNFPIPTVVNQIVQLELQFPPVLDLSCCVNRVNYCFDVTFTNEDCTSCMYTICTRPVKQASSQDDPGSLPINTHSGTTSDKISEFNLVPNPANGVVEISLINEALIGGKVTVNSLSGSVLLSLMIKEKREIIDISKLSPGSYVVSIEKNGKTSTETLVIR